MVCTRHTFNRLQTSFQFRCEISSLFFRGIGVISRWGTAWFQHDKTKDVSRSLSLRLHFTYTTSASKWLMHKVSTKWPYFVWTCIMHQPLLLIFEQVLFFFSCKAALFPQWHFVSEPIIQAWKIAFMKREMKMNVYNARWLRAHEDQNCTALKFMFGIRKTSAVPRRNASTAGFGIDGW